MERINKNGIRTLVKKVKIQIFFLQQIKEMSLQIKKKLREPKQDKLEKRPPCYTTVIQLRAKDKEKI